MGSCLFSPSGLNIIIYNLVSEMRSWIPVIYVILFNIKKEVDNKKSSCSMLSDLCPFIDEWITRVYKPDGIDSYEISNKYE